MRFDILSLFRSYAMKIAFIAAAFVLPMIAIMIALLRQIDDVERTSQKELRAAAVLVSAVDLLHRIEDCRDAVALAIAPPEGALSVAQAQNALNSALARFDTSSNREFRVTREWDEILRTAHAAQRDRRGASGERETKAIAALFKYMDALSDRSYLTYDSQVDVQSMADVLTNNYARAVDGIHLSNIMAVRAAVKGGMSVRDRVRLYSAKQRFAARVPSLLDDVRQSNDAAPALRARLAPITPALFAATRKFADTLEREVIEAEPVRISPRRVEGMALAAQGGMETARALAVPALQSILRERLGRMSARKASIILSTLIAICLGIIIAVQITRAISKRDREALTRVEQHAAFLSAELAREHAERALRLTEAQFRAVFKDAAIGIAILDKRGKMLETNPTFVAMLGGDPPSPLFLYHQFFDRLMDGDDQAYEIEHPILANDDQEKWVDATLSIVRAADEATFVVWMLQDITERKRMEQRLVHDATHDALTGLANRHHFEAQLAAAFNDAQERGVADFAVLFVDLDHFKYINDTFGHAIGDVVLVSVAERLRRSINANDLVARFGGDEFAILLRGVDAEGEGQIDSIGRRIQRNVEQPMTAGSATVFTTASIGISVASENYKRAEDMLRDADTAMYNAKLTGRARHVTFDKLMHTRAANRLQMQGELRASLEARQFRLVYQPVVRMDDRSIVGCEALVRWDHPERGIVSPTEFMPAAESMGLAIPIGRFVLRSACEQLAVWNSTRLDGIAMNVNVSVSELFAPDFERFVVQTLRETGVPGSAITLEITESAIIDRESYASELIDRLKSHGLRICIDDFGTGYSSFRYLQQFKIDTLKIDRSFVSGDDGELASAPIVRSLISLAEAFSVRVVAEGVETEAQRNKLIELGCTYAQGFLFAQPVEPGLLLPV